MRSLLTTVLTLGIFFSPFTLSSQDKVSCKIRYERFDTEILVYAVVSNLTDSTLSLSSDLDLVNLDLSGIKIENSSTQSLLLEPQTKKTYNLSTLEYSVLSESTLYLNLRQKMKLLASDSLNLQFPNLFRNVGKDGQFRDVEFDLGGLKIDRTRTPVGREFFELFEKNWKSPSNVSDYTIEFEELPFRFRTTILKVYLDGDIILETYLRDNEDFINRIHNYVSATIKAKLADRGKRNDELGGKWNGI